MSASATQGGHNQHPDVSTMEFRFCVGLPAPLSPARPGCGCP